MIVYRQKDFATLSHYTGNAADLVNDPEGFITGSGMFKGHSKDIPVSFFPTDFDELRNDPDYNDIFQMRLNNLKRDHRMERLQNNYYWKTWYPAHEKYGDLYFDYRYRGNKDAREKIPDDVFDILLNEDKNYSGKHFYRYPQGRQSAFLWKDNGTPSPGYRFKESLAGQLVGNHSLAYEHRIRDLEEELRNSTGLDNESRKELEDKLNLLKKCKTRKTRPYNTTVLPTGKEAVVFNDGYKMISAIDGVRGGIPYLGKEYEKIDLNELRKQKFYRVLVDTKNKDLSPFDMDGASGHYDFNEVRASNNDLDLNTRRVEIPKGYYKGGHLKKGYIEDLAKIGEGKYSKEDEYTQKVLRDMKKKLNFLTKGHGKLKLK